MGDTSIYNVITVKCKSGNIQGHWVELNTVNHQTSQQPEIRKIHWNKSSMISIKKNKKLSFNFTSNLSGWVIVV